MREVAIAGVHAVVNPHAQQQVVLEYSPSLDEEGVCKTEFDLIFAFDEAISLGNKENVTVQQVKQYCEMESHEEKAHKLVMQAKINETKDVMKKKANELDKMRVCPTLFSSFKIYFSHKAVNDMSISDSRFGIGSGLGGLSADMGSFASKPKGRPSTAATAPGKGFVTTEEKLNVVVKRDGSISEFDVQGTLALQVLNDADGFIHLQIESQDIPGLSFKTHPNINKELFSSQQILGAKDPNRPFPSGQNETALSHMLLLDVVNCWPSVSGNETYVNIEYEASEMFDLHNVVICLPLPALQEAPSVRQIDGEWK
nr:unnamed protein product [Digitaria exilis]